MERQLVTAIKAVKVVEKNQTSLARRLEQVRQKAFLGLKTLPEEKYKEGLKEYREYIANLEQPGDKEDSEMMLVISKNKE